MAKDKRSNKWAFLIYPESAPDNYEEVLNGMQIPWILSPEHNQDVNATTGELKKPHRHGALFFESLKSYSQVSELVSENLHSPEHVEVVMSPKGMYDYFTHAENPGKTQYDVKDIKSGSGFELEKFLLEQNADTYMNQVIDVVESENITEFEELVYYARDHDYTLLSLIVEHAYFFSKYLDSRRHNPKRKSDELREQNMKGKTDDD